ncbi:TetR/AcrR family transcriptional regulator [Chelativorans composti]|uniref:TetR/AcrR family transcriptional regulator n=1 Tax=Chelativorans composti TaxID=768533 RepID=A0ABW5DJ15_9HYPH
MKIAQNEKSLDCEQEGRHSADLRGEDLQMNTDNFDLLSNADYFFSTYMVDRTLTKKGKEVTLKILEAARLILIEKGSGSLTLRDVARAAGIRLSNLQYYYPTREDLVRDLLMLVFSVYQQLYDQIFRSEGIGAQEKLAQAVRCLLANIKEPSVHRLFFELWALAQRNELLEHLLRDMYDSYCRRIEEIIEQISPDMPQHLRRQRSILIAFLIEGIMVRYSLAQEDGESLRNMDDECLRQIQRMVCWS